MTFFGNNRRDCWAAVSCKAPLDVKRAIWEHEKDELIYDPRMGKAHVTEEDLGSNKESDMIPGRVQHFTRGFTARVTNPGSKASLVHTSSSGGIMIRSSTAARSLNAWLNAKSWN